MRKSRRRESIDKPFFVHVPKTGGSAIRACVDCDTEGHTPVPDTDQFTFAFVRNPYDRLVSGFFYLKEGGINKMDRKWAKDNVQPFTFEGFVKKLDSVLDWFHFTPQYYFITRNGKIAVDFLGRFERINEDFQALCEKLGEDATFHKDNTSRHEDYRQYYTKELQDIVYDTYKKDFELFNYKYEL